MGVTPGRTDSELRYGAFPLVRMHLGGGGGQVSYTFLLCITCKKGGGGGGPDSM